MLQGTPDNTVTLHLGGGRKTMGGRVLEDAGFNFNTLRSSRNPWSGIVNIRKGNGAYGMAMSQVFHSMDVRDVVREGSLADYKSNPSLPRKITP